MAFFLVGEKFFNLEELNKARLEYEKSNFVNMVMRDAKSLEAVRKYAPKRVKGARADLRYYTVRLCCTFGGKKYKTQGHNKRMTGYDTSSYLLCAFSYICYDIISCCRLKPGVQQFSPALPKFCLVPITSWTNG